jgi:hypothetical protein
VTPFSHYILNIIIHLDQDDDRVKEYRYITCFELRTWMAALLFLKNPWYHLESFHILYIYILSYFIFLFFLLMLCSLGFKIGSLFWSIFYMVISILKNIHAWFYKKKSDFIVLKIKKWGNQNQNKEKIGSFFKKMVLAPFFA